MRNSILTMMARKTVQLPVMALALFVISPITQAVAATCYIYQVHLQGTTSIGDASASLATQQFSLNQFAIVRDSGFRRNRVEFWLTAGEDLNASQKVGQVNIMTNSAFANNLGIQAQRYDLANVSQNNRFNFQFITGAHFIMPPPNVFVAPGYGDVAGGLGGVCYISAALCQIVRGPSVLSASYMVPYQGGGNFYFPDRNSIAGELEMTGAALDNMSFRGAYQAAFRGNFVNAVECN